MEAKSAAILLATLGLGVALGMVSQGLLMRERTLRVDRLRRPPGFVGRMEEVIQPRDDQRDTVRAILEATARRNDTIIGSARTQLGAALDAMRLQLDPLLDGGQRERLARTSRLPDPFRPPPRREGPPPEGGPPPGERPPPREGPPPPN